MSTFQRDTSAISSRPFQHFSARVHYRVIIIITQASRPPSHHPTQPPSQPPSTPIRQPPHRSIFRTCKEIDLPPSGRTALMSTALTYENWLFGAPRVHRTTCHPPLPPSFPLPYYLQAEKGGIERLTSFVARKRPSEPAQDPSRLSARTECVFKVCGMIDVVRICPRVVVSATAVASVVLVVATAVVEVVVVSVVQTFVATAVVVVVAETC